MPYELFIALRYLRARRQQTAVSVVTLIAVTGITFGVAALIFAQGLARGFHEEVQAKILGGTAHLNLLRKDNAGIEGYRELLPLLQQVPGVSSVSATTYEPVLLSAGDRQEPAVIKGIDLAAVGSLRDDALSELTGSLIAGEIKELQPPDDSQSVLAGIILGKDLARILGVRRGDVVTVFSSRTRLTPVGPAPRYTRFRVAGSFAAGLYEYDSKWAYLSLTAVQRLTGSGDTASTIQMKVSDIYAVREIGERVLAAAQRGGQEQELMVTNWQELNRPLFAALTLQQRVVVLFFLLLIVIAALNIITTLTMMVLEKQSDIAILRAQGSTPRAIRRIFMFQGLATGVFGAVIGTLLGLGAGWIANTWKLIAVPPEIYSVSHITLRVSWWECVGIMLLAVLISLLATIYPAHIAARLHPAEVLRHE